MNEDKEEAIDRLTREFRERLSRELPDGPMDISEIEDRVSRVVRENRTPPKSGTGGPIPE